MRWRGSAGTNLQESRGRWGKPTVMAHTGHTYDMTKRPAHDGALRCVLCADTGPGADHGWCEAAACIVCDDCCASLLDGDAHRLVSIIANAGRIVTPDALLTACSRCERVTLRLAADDLAAREDEGEPTFC
jgi:hypothetical protein